MIFFVCRLHFSKKDNTHYMLDGRNGTIHLIYTSTFENMRTPSNKNIHLFIAKVHLSTLLLMLVVSGVLSGSDFDFWFFPFFSFH